MQIQILERLQAIERRYEELNHLMAQPEVTADHERLQQIAKEQASIQYLVSRYRDLKATAKALEDTTAMLREGLDEELETLVKEEMEKLKERQDKLLNEIKLALLPKDPSDEKDVIVEIRAGTGGDEAGLFAADLFRMYARYAESHRWSVDVISSNESGIGGFKEIVFEINGRRAYSRLKFESGVHRVQRVPLTEASGRIHTSTATVAVLPEAEEVEVDINPDDLRIDIFHAGGHGGQNVQKVATAVRIIHQPTGIVAICQDERSQLRNRTKAMTVLRARLLERERHRLQEEEAQVRRSQVGTGERAEKIRTYNYPQNRVTDHRINLTLYDLSNILEGSLDPIIDAVATADQARRLEEQLV